MRIAFLGLGHMGLPMAKNLAATGHEVVGFDVAPAAVAAAGEAGLATADSGTDAATGADVVITMFQTGAQVLDAYRGAGGGPGLLEVAASGALFIDCSTIAVDEARAAHTLAGVGRRRGRRERHARLHGGRHR
jgi:3-hydroxyisobutyrate dehydrogenase